MKNAMLSPSDMTTPKFRTWCSVNGFHLRFDADAGAWTIQMSDEDMQNFAVTVLEQFAKKD